MPVAAGQASSTAVVTLDSGPTVQLCADCSPRQVRLAVTAKSGLQIKRTKTYQENPKIVEVSFGNVRDTSLLAEFTPTWELNKSGTPGALLIGVSDKIRKAGNYDLILSLQPETAPSAPRLKLEIVHPAGKLELPEKLLVDRTDYWPFYTTVDKMRLDVRESTAASEVLDVSLQPRASTQGSDLVTGQLDVDTTSPAPSINPSGSNTQSAGATLQPFVAAGKTRQLNYELSGQFPLGVVTGSVRFFAPELTDLATLNFEVHSKLTKVYLLIAIMLGLFLSWFLKVYLHNRIELAEGISKAASLLDRVQTDWNGHHDNPFRDSLTPPITTLNHAIEGHDAAAIATAMTRLIKPGDLPCRTMRRAASPHARPWMNSAG